MKKRGLLLTAALMLVLGGCGFSKDVDTTTLIVDKKGEVTEAIVEDFDKDYYNADELKQEIEGTIRTYNSSAGGEKAALDDFKKDEGTNVLKVRISYATAADYTQMNERELFCGTVSDAYNAGYQFVTMAAADGSSISETEILEKGSSKIVIYEGGKSSVDVKVSGKISYISAESGIVLNDKADTASLPEGEGKLFYLIYE